MQPDLREKSPLRSSEALIKIPMPGFNSQKILILLHFLEARNNHVTHVWPKQPKNNFTGVLFESQFAEKKWEEENNWLVSLLALCFCHANVVP